MNERAMRRGWRRLGRLAALLLLLVPAKAARAAPAPLRLSAKQAVARALKHNLSLEVERLNPALSKASELEAEASFEPELFAEINASDYPGQVSRQRAGLAPTSSTSVGGDVGARKQFSSGTSVELTLSSMALYGGGVLDPSYQSGAVLSVRQSLLKGISPSANTVEVATARLSRKEAAQQLSRKAEQVAASTLAAYFDLQAALSRDAIQALAIETSARTLRDTKVLIAGGKLAASEEISARYTLQTQRRAKLQAEHDVADARDRLARLTGMVRPGSLATPLLRTVPSAPSLPAADALQQLLAGALRRRGDYLATQERIAAARARVHAARHRLLPKLDAVGSVFLSGLSGDVAPELAADGASADVERGYFASYKMDQVGWSAGLVLELPLGNHAARGQLRRAELQLHQAEREADLVRQTIAEELNRAWRAVQLTREQQTLTALAAQVAQTKVHNEEALYKAGKSTAHILASVQADALKEQLSVAQAGADLSKALVQLHVAAGGLLARLHLAH